MVAEADTLVLPGDLIGTSEEFMAGENAYEQNGLIYAAATGRVKVDKKERRAGVEPTTDMPPVPREGDIVVGRVTDIRGSVALVELARIKGHETREIAKPEQAAIHISNVKDAYVKDLEHEFGFHDIVKAKVIDVENMRLTTVGEDLGVLKAICPRDKTPMVREEDEKNKLHCPHCDRWYTRKISEDYGKGII